MKICNWIAAFLFLSISILTQPIFCAEDQEIDTLLAQLSNSKEDTLKVNILIKLADKTSWSNIKSSQEYARQALDISQRINYRKGLAYSKFQLAIIFDDYEIDLSENLVLQALDHAQEINDSILIARVYNILGNLKLRLNHTDDALRYYNKSLDIYLMNKQDSSAAAIYGNLGVLHSNLSNDSLSIVYYLKAIEINKKTKNYLWLSIIYMNMGYDFIESGKLKEGFDLLKQSQKMADEYSINRLYPWIYNNLSRYFLVIENCKVSIEYANKALIASRDQANRLEELHALTNLKNAYFQNSELKNAYEYFEKIIIVIDSINKHNRLKELDLLEIRYRYEKERKDQELETAILEANYHEKELIYVLIILGSIFVIFTFIFLHYMQRNRSRRKSLEQKTTILEKDKLAKDLEFKKKELTTNVIYLLKKNEFISEISNKLKNVNLESSETGSNTIERIILELDKSISDNNWEEFEVRFQEVHVGFYNKLNRQFPALTPNELRLSAFLRLNMTSKEIADITYQSRESIKTARYRLRKKLDLTRGENLVTFLTKY